MNEEICDFKFAIWDLIPLRGRQARGRHDGSQFDGFLMQSRNHLCFQQSIIDDQFHPISGFISFFLNRSELRNELRFRPGSSHRTIVCRNSSSAAQQLFTEHLRFSGSRQMLEQSDDPKRKSLSPIPQLFGLLKFCSISTHSKLPGNRNGRRSTAVDSR